MKKFQWMLAFATVALLAVGCGDDNDDGTTPATDTATADTAVTDTAATDTTATDTTAVDTLPGDATVADDTASADVAADVTTTGDKGCLAAADQAYLKSLEADKPKADKFAGDVTACTLGSCNKETEQAGAAACVGKCLVVDKAHPITQVCGGCYGIRAFCAFVNCVKNPAEAPTAACVTGPNAPPCIACQEKYGCIKASDDCKAGK